MGPGGANGTSKTDQKKKKNAAKELMEFSDDDDDESKVPNANSLGLNISPWEEDPVQEQFKMETDCTEQDKENENKAKEDRRSILQKLFEKIQKIQDSIQSKRKSDDDYKQFFR